MSTLQKPVYYLVQRDIRSSLLVKRFYAILVTITMLLCIVSLVGNYVDRTACSVFHNQVAANWNSAASPLLYALIGFVGVWFLFSLVLCIQWKWLWMTQAVRMPPRYGEDVEDLDPGISARSATDLQQHSSALLQNIDHEIDKAYDES